jgi:hypothetical protein
MPSRIDRIDARRLRSVDNICRNRRDDRRETVWAGKNVGSCRHAIRGSRRETPRPAGRSRSCSGLRRKGGELRPRSSGYAPMLPVMRLRGFEPPRSFEQYDLNVSCLPVPPQPRGTANLPVEAPRRVLPIRRTYVRNLLRDSDGIMGPSPSRLANMSLPRRYRLGD